MPHYNDFMHHNNVFKKKPDFKTLALEFKELAQYMSTGLRGKLRYDFDNPEALRAFTCALMKRQFQKELILPTNRLIPAIPQRLNYICWIEDLVRLLNISCNDQVIGLDIGTGASCIIPILSVHRNNNWNFLAVEVDNESYEFATENAQRNGLTERIKVLLIQDSSAQLCDMMHLADKRPMHFITCNPPFFDQEYDVNNPKAAVSDADMDESRGRPKSKSNTANIKEAVTSGGEIEFVKNLLTQSENCREDVLIFTSMLGRKKSLQHYKRVFSCNQQISSWTWAELCQGKTIRYAIAWTYVNGLDLEKAPPLRLGKVKKWSFKLPHSKTNEVSVEFAKNVELLKQLVTFDLKIEKMKVVRSSIRSIEFIIRTQHRPWLNQRRKRREAARMNQRESSQNNTNLSLMDTTPCDEVKQTTDGYGSETESIDSNTETNNTASDNLKRKRKYSDSGSSLSLQDSIGSLEVDQMKMKEEECGSNKRLKINEPDEHEDNIEYLVRCRCTLTRAGHDLYFELRVEYPCKSANDAHDLFLFFKNKLTSSSHNEI